MIRFDLICDKDHEFDGWFSSSEDFASQKKRGLVACPICNSVEVEKALMAPQVRTGRSKEAVPVAQMMPEQAEIMRKLKELRDQMIASSDDVGRAFAEEARKIHYGEKEERAIRGEAEPEEVSELLEEGIGVLPIPTLPEDAN